MSHPYGLGRKLIDAGLLICLSIGALYGGARSGLAPKVPERGVAVVFAPWTSPSEVFARAVASGSRFVGYGNWPFIAIVVPDSAAYSDRMFDDGAWLVVDAEAPASCSSSITQKKT